MLVRTLHWRFLVCGVLMAAALGPSIALASTTVTTVPITGRVVHNPCNGDVVVLRGKETIIFEIGNGQAHITSHTAELEGAGVPFAQFYRGTYNSQARIDLGDFPISTTLLVKVRLQSTGEQPNFDSTLHTHITINNNGVPTAEVTGITTKCAG